MRVIFLSLYFYPFPPQIWYPSLSIYLIHTDFYTSGKKLSEAPYKKGSQAKNFQIRPAPHTRTHTHTHTHTRAHTK